MKWLTYILLLSFFINTGCSEKKPINNGEAYLEGRCVGVSDGDTFTLLTKKNKQFKIRLAHIDCPEKGQPFGQKAKEFTSDFCFGKDVRVKYMIKKAKDRNGRVIGVVYNSNGVELNYKLVESGMAWHFKKYSNEDRYGIAEDNARAAHIGLWKEPSPMAPWDWRKN